MEAQEEAMESKEHMHIIKGKRTKRPRPSSPLALTMASASSTSPASPTNSVEFMGNIKEEEDMAKCLILLAQGQQVPKLVITPPNGYQCKTCSRSFPSFQALGGHRASHKKPRASIDGKKPLHAARVHEEEEEEPSTRDDGTTLSLGISTSGAVKSRVHECSICGAEFTSGQALGGHMRRHRAPPMPTNCSDHQGDDDHQGQDAKKPRSILSLDLNLPAPELEDGHRGSNLIPFAATGQVIVFSASPLVDCHY